MAALPISKSAPLNRTCLQCGVPPSLNRSAELNANTNGHFQFNFLSLLISDKLSPIGIAAAASERTPTRSIPGGSPSAGERPISVCVQLKPLRRLLPNRSHLVQTLCRQLAPSPHLYPPLLSLLPLLPLDAPNTGKPSGRSELASAPTSPKFSRL
jgi:hypothetical protein